MPPTVINICAQRQRIISTSVTEDEYTLHPDKTLKPAPYGEKVERGLSPH